MCNWTTITRTPLRLSTRSLTHLKPTIRLYHTTRSVCAIVAPLHTSSSSASFGSHSLSSRRQHRIAPICPYNAVHSTSISTPPLRIQPGRSADDTHSRASCSSTGTNALIIKYFHLIYRSMCVCVCARCMDVIEPWHVESPLPFRDRNTNQLNANGHIYLCALPQQQQCASFAFALTTQKHRHTDRDVHAKPLGPLVRWTHIRPAFIRKFELWGIYLARLDIASGVAHNSRSWFSSIMCEYCGMGAPVSRQGICAQVSMRHFLWRFPVGFSDAARIVDRRLWMCVCAWRCIENTEWQVYK